MLPQEGEKCQLHFIHKTSSKPKNSSEELIDVPNSVFGDIDQVDQNQPASPIGAVIDERNLLPYMKLDNPVQNIHLFKDSKDKSAEELLQLIKNKVVDISKFLDYKHTVPTEREKKGWVWKDLQYLTQKKKKKEKLCKYRYVRFISSYEYINIINY